VKKKKKPKKSTTPDPNFAEPGVHKIRIKRCAIGTSFLGKPKKFTKYSKHHYT